MSWFKLLSPAILTTLVAFALSVNAYADQEIQIVTPVPPPQEQTVVPQGYAACFNVPANWYNGVWYPEHRVCQYDPKKVHTAEGDAYVDAHWACTKYAAAANNQAQCVSWSWKKGHWIKTFTPY